MRRFVIKITVFLEKLCRGRLINSVAGFSIVRGVVEWFFVDSQPWQSILQLKPVAGVADGVNIWVEACHELAGASWDHRNTRRQ